MEATCFSETSLEFQRTTWLFISTGRTLNNHPCHYLKFSKKYKCSILSYEMIVPSFINSHRSVPKILGEESIMTHWLTYWNKENRRGIIIIIHLLVRNRRLVISSWIIILAQEAKYSPNKFSLNGTETPSHFLGEYINICLVEWRRYICHDYFCKGWQDELLLADPMLEKATG
jgi:hypothetical protein